VVRSWLGLTQQQVSARIGRSLGVRFAASAAVGLGGQPDGLADLGADRYVAFEFELSQSHPSTNVLKYWPWLERSKRRLVLVHAIAPDARKRSGPRTDLTVWLGARMQRTLRGRFQYCRIDLGSPSERDQLEAARATVARLREAEA
jgi:hypothetical protein